MQGCASTCCHHPWTGAGVPAELSTCGCLLAWGPARRLQGEPGWREQGRRGGLLRVLPSPSRSRGGDVGSCSAKPCSFSPLKPDYSGGACACVLGRGGEGISQQVFAATLGPDAPRPPKARWSLPCSREQHRGGALGVTAELQPPAAQLGAPWWQCGQGTLDLAGGQHWGLEMDTAAPCAV